MPYTVLKQNRIVRAGAGWEEARPNLTSVRGIFFWNEDGSHHYQPSAAFGTDLAFAAGAITENITTFELWDVDPTSDLNITISIMSGFSSLVDNIVPQQVSVYVNGAEKISGLFAGQTKSVYILNSDLVDALQDHDAGTIRLSLRSDANNFQSESCKDVTANYTVEGDRIKVQNCCSDESSSLQPQCSTGWAYQTKNEGVLAVSFFPGIYGSYTVIKRETDISIVSNPDRESLWILSREPVLAKVRYSGIVSWLDKNGYDTDKLIVNSSSNDK